MRQDGGSRGQGSGRQDGNPSDKGDSQGGPRAREVASSSSPAGARGSEGEAPLKDTATKGSAALVSRAFIHHFIKIPSGNSLI